MTDAGFRFHIGTPLPDLRQIASWMLTHAPRKRPLAKLIPALWKRHGREDLSMAGLLLANLDANDIGQDPWMAFIHLLQRQEPLMVVLEVAEELVRGGHAVPDDAWLEAAAQQSPQWHQYCVLFLSLRRQAGGCRQLIETAPQVVKCLSASDSDCWKRSIEGASSELISMVERLLPADDPVLENVLKWTVERDAKDVRRLLEWLPEARSSRERKALLQRVRGLLAELEAALDELDSMH